MAKSETCDKHDRWRVPLDLETLPGSRHPNRWTVQDLPAGLIVFTLSVPPLAQQCTRVPAPFPEPSVRRVPAMEYWSFYWPLTLMGVCMLAGSQFQNGILSRYPEAARELTTFALAVSFHSFLHAALIFIPQMSNVYGKSRAAIQACLRFAMKAGFCLSLPMVFLGWTNAGPWLAKWIFGVDPSTADVMQMYFRLLAPVTVLDSLRHALTGLLVQARLTGAVTLLNVLYLATVLSLLLAGFHMGYAAVYTVGFAQLGAATCALIATWFVWRRSHQPQDDSAPAPKRGELWSFFWPVAITSMCFALSRPVIFFFASRTSDALVLIAGLRVAFDFGMLFFNPVNQFRHLIVTFGLADRRGIQKFLSLVALSLSGLLAITALTPLGHLIFASFFALEGDVLRIAVAALLPMTLVPLAMGMRNWLHGIAMLSKSTRKMGAASIARLGIITLLAWLLLVFGWLGPITASLLLALGFLAETAMMWILTQKTPLRAGVSPHRAENSGSAH